MVNCSPVPNHNIGIMPVEIYPGTYAPCRKYDIDPSGKLIPSWLVLIIGIGSGIILLYSEYIAHDCVPGKKCTHSVQPPDPDDDYDVYISKLTNMVRNNYDFVSWRQSLLAGILAALLVIFYLRGRLATLMELFVVVIIVFIFVYMSYSWVWAHFFYPNGKVIENQLQILNDRLTKENKNISPKNQFNHINDTLVNGSFASGTNSNLMNTHSNIVNTHSNLINNSMDSVWRENKNNGFDFFGPDIISSDHNDSNCFNSRNYNEDDYYDNYSESYYSD